MKAWEARHRGAAVIAVLDKEVKPQRVQAYQCWKLDCKRLWVAANKSKKKKSTRKNAKQRRAVLSLREALFKKMSGRYCLGA